jgi:hypothetical protein
MTEMNNNSGRMFILKIIYPIQFIFKYIQYILNIVGIIILLSSNSENKDVEKYLTIMVSIISILSLIMLCGQLFVNNIDIFNGIIIVSQYIIQISGLIIFVIIIDIVSSHNDDNIYNDKSFIMLVTLCLYQSFLFMAMILSYILFVFCILAIGILFIIGDMIIKSCYGSNDNNNDNNYHNITNTDSTDTDNIDQVNNNMDNCCIKDHGLCAKYI